MIQGTGWWYDGKTSARREVRIACSGDSSLCVEGEGVAVSCPLADVTVDPRLGAARRMIRFPGGAALETADHEFPDRLLRLQRKGGFFRHVHRWESSLKLALLALLLTVGVAVCFVRYGVPFLATQAAFALPPETEDMLGRESLQILDSLVLKPSTLDEERRRDLTRLFSSMTAGHSERRGWRLEFRSGEKIGANAFALPSGIVILTDRLVEIAASDEEIAAVLAHEVGHVNRRHALRHVLQNSATAVLVATVTGDIVSASSLSATLPTLLINARYSRDFEIEADDAAVQYLKQKGLPVRPYADILLRLAKDHGMDAKEKDASGFGEIFSDHPLAEERVRRVLAGS